MDLLTGSLAGVWLAGLNRRVGVWLLGVCFFYLLIQDQPSVACHAEPINFLPVLNLYLPASA